MIRFLLLAATFGSLSWVCYRQGMPDPALGFFVGAGSAYGSAVPLTLSIPGRLRAVRRSVAAADVRDPRVSR